MHRSVLFGSLCTVLLAAACSSSHGATVSLPSERTGSIQWDPCGPTIQCGRLSVPLDRAHPRKGDITLALARRPASGKRVGVLFTNPGGPGGSGVDFLRAADDEFPPRSVMRSISCRGIRVASAAARRCVVSTISTASTR